MRFLLFLCCLCIHSYAEDLFGAFSSSNIYRFVNVISGDLTLGFHDTEIRGAVPLSIQRHYSSSGALERSEKNTDLLFKGLAGRGIIQGGWTFFPHIHLFVSTKEKKDASAFAKEPSGVTVHYAFDREDSKHGVDLKATGDFPMMDGALSAANYPKNNTLYVDFKHHKAEIRLPSGGKRIYKKLGKPNRHYKMLPYICYNLVEEILPSGHRITYYYIDDSKLQEIAIQSPSRSKSFAKLMIGRENKDYIWNIKTSDNQSLQFNFFNYENREYIDQASSPASPLEKYVYHPARKCIGARIQNLSLRNQTKLNVAYYMPPNITEERRLQKHPRDRGNLYDKVKRITINGEQVTFDYKENKTIVRDEQNHLIHYYHKDHKLTRIDSFDANDELYASERLYWQGDRLICKALFSNEEKAILAKSFSYDHKGNVLSEHIWGEITGSGEILEISPKGEVLNGESYGKYYQYDDFFNVPISIREDNGLVTKYGYLHNTNLLSSKFTCDQDQIIIRQFYHYNGDHLLICEIEDDGISPDAQSLEGVTQRVIKRYQRDHSGLIVEIQQSYWDPLSAREVALQTTKLHYNEKKQVVQEDVYDARGVFQYSLYTKYNPAGKISQKSDPLGRWNLYQYDEFGKLIAAKKANSSVLEEYSYDVKGRKILTRKVYPDGSIEEQRSEYPNKRLIVNIDDAGHRTKEHLDDFGRCITTQMPEIPNSEGVLFTPAYSYSNDIQGNISSVTTTTGITTQTRYNVFRKPLYIEHPDGARNQYEYNTDATLAKITYPDGSYYLMEYDVLQRMRHKKLYDVAGGLIEEESWEHSSFQLKTYTDPKGLTTYYHYDGSGRKVAEETEVRKISFAYDDLGQLYRVLDHATGTKHFTIKDLTGRTVREWHGYANKKENEKIYLYNDDDKLIRCTSGDAVDLFAYDHKGRITSHIDPLGNEKHLIYDDHFLNAHNQKVLSITTIDPQGNSTQQIHDALGHVVSTIKRLPSQEIIYKEDAIYDETGNKIKRISTVFQNHIPIKEIVTMWEYDERGRVIQAIEPLNKVTSYTYDIKGRVSEKIKPDGIILSYFYDAKDRVIETKSSDGTIHYRYDYENFDAPVLIEDLVHYQEIRRSYDLRGNLISEKDAIGHNYHWEYDAADRCIKFTLPDATSIHYEYHGNHLVQVIRAGPEGEYAHIYEEFDDKGHVIKETTISNQSVDTFYDLLERPIKQLYPTEDLSSAYNEVGLMTASTNSYQGNKSYTYDGLQQLSKEDEKEYFFDSLGNPYGNDVITNDLNQIEQRQGCDFTYDSNGNLTSKTKNTYTITYTYDALDRLIEISDSVDVVQYFYDGLDRLIQKKEFTSEDGFWGETQDIKFLYDKNTEIGATFLDLIFQLRVLGLGYSGDVGAAIAIEINGNVYQPIHDLKGNILAITYDQKLVENYDYNAFGYQIYSQGINPWRFSSKRFDSDLIYFGKRFYDPFLERWLTPDPAGDVDSSNLYTYVLNDPINRLDLFGLFSTDPFDKVPYIKAFQPPKMVMGLQIREVFFGTSQVKVFIVAGQEYPVDFSLATIETGRSSLIDALKQAIPQNYICTPNILINGINVSLEEFQNNCHKLYEQFKDPVIGFYNETRGVTTDYMRVKFEQDGFETKAVWQARELLVLTVDTITKINPNAFINCIVHSEGGLIYGRAFEGMNPDYQELMKQKLSVLAFGPAILIPKKYGKYTINFYSISDYITKPSQKSLNNMSNYDEFNIQLLPCQANRNQKTARIADHNFVSPTYQTALTREINMLKKTMRDKYENSK